MALSPGTRLGAYEVVSPLGAGGMGEVYRARDGRLGREVAIKVLPEGLTREPERLARFEREGRLLASLNHPNIATLHGFEQTGEQRFLVMELVPGETLAARLSKGPLPLEEALDVCRQIAEALEAAHEKGVLHRDLKPANVKVTPERRVKLLDFGLAKAFWGGEDDSASPTASHGGTREGVILGTAPYMSPEQARGQRVDKRSDIWSFGCVLYEALAGQRSFGAATLPETLTRVLGAEPDWSAIPASAPEKARNLLRRCLQKDPSRRLHDIADARLEIEEMLAAPASAAARPAVGEGRGRRVGLLRHAALLSGAAVVASLATWVLTPSPAPPQPVSRTAIVLPPGQRLAGLDRPALALSPDGRLLVYVAIQGGTQQLYLRPLESLEARPIAGTEGAMSPFFSPDGQWVGFFAGQKLRKVSVSGGAVITLGNAPDPEGASWSIQGTIAFAPSTVSALLQLSDRGGDPQPLTRLDKAEATHRWPVFLPDGKAVLFGYGGTTGNWENQHVAVQSVETGERRNLVQLGMYPAYAPSGHLIYAQRGTLMAIPFDPRRPATTGTAVPVVDGVLQAATGASQYSISAAGSLAYVPGGVQSARLSLVWVARNGVEQPVAAPARSYAYPRLSPDGLRVAVGVAEPATQLWLYDFARETLTRLTFEGSLSALPAWTADGRRIAFTSRTDGPLNLFWQQADGSGGLERLTTSEFNNQPMSWSPDGQLLAFGEVNPSTGFDILVLRMGDRTAQPFLRTPFNESSPRFSPDGRWLAYASDESGRQEIYVQPYPGPGGKWPISADGGREPVWNRNGRELFYRHGGRMMAVEVATHPAFAAGKPRLLFEGPYELTVFTAPNYDVSPDGQRLLMLKHSEPETAGPAPITVVLNWVEELKRRVPPGKK